MTTTVASNRIIVWSIGRITTVVLQLRCQPCYQTDVIAVVKDECVWSAGNVVCYDRHESWWPMVSAFCLSWIRSLCWSMAESRRLARTASCLIARVHLPTSFMHTWRPRRKEMSLMMRVLLLLAVIMQAFYVQFAPSVHLSLSSVEATTRKMKRRGKTEVDVNISLDRIKCCANFLLWRWKATSSDIKKPYKNHT